MVTSPKDIFDNPAAYWDRLTCQDDIDFEEQQFDRKEAGRAENGKPRRPVAARWFT